MRWRIILTKPVSVNLKSLSKVTFFTTDKPMLESTQTVALNLNLYLETVGQN